MADALCSMLASSSQSGMSLFCSDIDLHFAPAAPLKQVASLLCECRDGSGQRSFVDVDVLGSARVPIVAMTHAATKIEIDLSCVTSQQDTETPRLIAAAVAQHDAMRPLSLVLKALLMQRGLHETFHGGLSSFKLYVLLAAWLDATQPSGDKPPARAGPNAPTDLGARLLCFLEAYSTELGRAPVVSRGVEVDLSRVRVQDCMAAFAEAARALRTHRRLAAVIDARALQRMRQRSFGRATAFTEALLAERRASSAMAGGGPSSGHDQSAVPPHAPPLAGMECRPKRPRAPAMEPAATYRRTEPPTQRGGGIFDLVQ